MFLAAVVTTVCTGGVAFYLRFLLALCRQKKRRLIGYWLLIQPGANEGNVPEQEERFLQRAA